MFIHSYMVEDSGDHLDYRENSIFNDAYWGATRRAVFMRLMAHYKNTVLFHGHSHTMYQCQQYDKAVNYTERNGFRSVHVPSLSLPRYMDLETEKAVEDQSGSQGCIVDAYDDYIILRGYGYITDEPIPLGTLKIDTTLVEIEAGTFTDSTGIISV